jgi:hypothetical protein
MFGKDKLCPARKLSILISFPDQPPQLLQSFIYVDFLTTAVLNALNFLILIALTNSLLSLRSMKRTRSKTGDTPSFVMHEDGAPLEKQQSREQRANGLATPPSSPEAEGRPSKARRHGSKFLLALRTFTNSGKPITVIYC